MLLYYKEPVSAHRSRLPAMILLPVGQIDAAKGDQDA